MPGTNGKAVVLVHGLTGAPGEMKLVAKQLNRAGYTIYAPLLAGHGVDKATLLATRWQDWLESVVRAAEKVRTEADAVFTAGICVGGKLGMLAAQQKPDIIRATAIYSPLFHYDGWNVPFYYPILSRHIGWLRYVPFLDRLNFAETDAIGIKDERLRKLMASLSAEGVMDDFPGRSLVEMHRLGSALKKQLPYLSAPTLILHAKEDDLSSPRNAELMDKHLGAPHRLEWIEDSYHMIHVDKQHKHVAALTADFFNETRVEEGHG